MMDRPECWSNHKYLSEMIDLLLLPKMVDSAKICKLYLERGLTVEQIAVELGLSRTFILTRLHKGGVKRDAVRKMVLPHPRPVAHSSYGHKIVNGQLVEHRAEMRVARMIVELRQRRKLSWTGIAKNLNAKGLKTRTGQTWKPGMISVVFKRWQGKV